MLGKPGIEHVDLEIGKEDLLGVIQGSVNSISSGEGIGRAHSQAGGVIPYQVIILKEHLPAGLSAGEALWFFKVSQVFVIH